MFFLMKRRPTRSTRTDTLVPYTTLVRSRGARGGKSARTAEELIPELGGVDRPEEKGGYEIDRRAGPDEQRQHHAALDEAVDGRSEEHTSELQSLMRISYAVFCLKKKNNQNYSAIQHQQ